MGGIPEVGGRAALPPRALDPAFLDMARGLPRPPVAAGAAGAGAGGGWAEEMGFIVRLPTEAVAEVAWAEAEDWTTAAARARALASA